MEYKESGQDLRKLRYTEMNDTLIEEKNGEITEEYKKRLFCDTYNSLFEVCENSENTEKHVVLVKQLQQIRALIKDGKIFIDDLRYVPEFFKYIVDTVGLTESDDNAYAALSTIWCITSYIPKATQDFIKNNCISACLTKIGFNRSVIPALCVLHYIIESEHSSNEFIFEEVSPSILMSIISEYESKFPIILSDNPDDFSEELYNLRVGHRDLINSATLLMIDCTQYLIDCGEDCDDKIQELLEYLLFAMKRSGHISLGHCYYCLTMLLKEDKTNVDELCEYGFQTYFESTIKQKENENCRYACFLMSVMFDKGWKGTYFPSISLMNYIKTCSGIEYEYIARELLAKACEKAAFIVKEEILKSIDFEPLVVLSIAREDEVTHAVGYGDFRIMKYSGLALCGIINDPVCVEPELFYSYDIMLALVSLLRITFDNLQVKVITAINNLIDRFAMIGSLDELRDHFESVNGMDIFDEFVEDTESEIHDRTIEMLQKLGLIDEED